ncbi:hypothetical protein CNBG_9289 [Cryptococcus deuterogattii R265]|uniref:Proline dehydrogenase n=1 Tax=Cryptococcus deuterogattii (strain R265) TaxID=294750 RepID=A0A0L6DHA3_CRYD2|nr:hypothetical protein I309_01840 [Cryptococcus deuterogattii LA55]KIR71788.1 hypothetical protein I310_04468 [Cryptococcus deuterogattii CA1014]KIR91370.1 hypothetical protein I304_04841 [Cryptococcus deuterogattii CBS 10090]KNX50065.1 hypothetical protein CNBG_9289 [Cryptococcus deuterogattii R265]
MRSSLGMATGLFGAHQRRTSATTFFSIGSIRRVSVGSFRQRIGHTRTLTALTLAIGAGASVLIALSPSASKKTQNQPVPTIESASVFSLARSYFVFTCCTIPIIIDNSTSLLNALTHSGIPGLAMVVNFFVRHTFFAQFVAGESVADCRDSMAFLRSRNVGTLLNYAAETDESLQVHSKDLEQLRLQEVERAIDEAGAFEASEAKKGAARGSTMFALKITGLIDPAILERASYTLLRYRSSPLAGGKMIPYPGAPTDDDFKIVANKSECDDEPFLSLKGEVPAMGVLKTDEGLRKGDLEALRSLWNKLRSLSERAKKQGIKILVDAEHSWYQPVIDAYCLLLSQEFNKPSPNDGKWNGPLIYGTYQSYLLRLPAFLEYSMKHAEEHGYALGVKLVRGAYFVQERSKWMTEGRPGPDPIWSNKPTTDCIFNEAVGKVLNTLSQQLKGAHPERALDVVIGTHNAKSVRLIIEGMEKYGLCERKSSGRLQIKDEARGKVFVGQLYGMKDDLGDLILKSFEPDGMPVAVKYVAYGPLSAIMAYLGRRASENKSLMTGDEGAAAERKRIVNELKRRLSEWM